MRTRLAPVLLLAAVAWLLPSVAAADADPLRGEQWGLEQIRAPAAWSRTRGNGAVIAVVDSGVDLDHPDLAGRLLAGATFVGCDDDGCGVGDWEDGETVGTRDPHGTHVAGIAAAAGDNGRGIAGVAPAASLLSVKVLQGSSGSGGSTGSGTDVAAGVRWAVRRGADVINLSIAELPGIGQALATTGSELRRAVSAAVEDGVVVVAAAGNEALPACDEPAFAPGVICVVATGRDALPASYSNRAGKSGTRVVAAPGGEVLLCGEAILSTIGAGQEGACSSEVGYGVMTGSSMAAPHVAGVAALLRAQGRSPEETVERILSTARTPGTAQRGSFSPGYGRGIVDADAATSDPRMPAPRVARAGGADRVATAVALSRAEHDRAEAVVLARSDEYADALAGGPLATSLGAPLLLSGPGRLSAAAAEEIRRLGATEAVMLGGEAALSPAVEHDLAALGLVTERIGGETRFHTGAAIAERLPAPSEVFVAEGMHEDPRRGWPDALSASGLAAATGSPILLVTTDGLPPVTAGALTPDRDVTVVGGTSSVSAGVAGALDARGGDLRRLAGADRYATAAAVAGEAMARGLGASELVAATGASFPDGLAAGAVAGARGGLLLLVPPDDLDAAPAVRDLLSGVDGGVRRLLIAGGTAAVTERVRLQLTDLVS